MKTIRITLVGILGIDEAKYTKHVTEKGGTSAKQQHSVVVSAKLHSTHSSGDKEQLRTPTRKNHNKKTANTHDVNINMLRVAQSCESKPLKLYNYALPKSQMDSDKSSAAPTRSPNNSHKTNETMRNVLGASWIQSRLLNGMSRTSILFLEPEDGQTHVVFELVPSLSPDNIQLGAALYEMDLEKDDVWCNEGARVIDLAISNHNLLYRNQHDNSLGTPSKLKRIFTNSTIPSKVKGEGDSSLLIGNSAFLRVMVEVYAKGSSVERLWFGRIALVSKLQQESKRPPSNMNNDYVSSDKMNYDVQTESSRDMSVVFDVEGRLKQDDEDDVTRESDEVTLTSMSHYTDGSYYTDDVTHGLKRLGLGYKPSTASSDDDLPTITNTVDSSTVSTKRNKHRNKIALSDIFACNGGTFICEEQQKYGESTSNCVLYLDDDQHSYPAELFQHGAQLQLGGVVLQDSTLEMPSDEAVVINKNQIEGINFDNSKTGNVSSGCEIKINPVVERISPTRDQSRVIEAVSGKVNQSTKYMPPSTRGDFDTASRVTYTLDTSSTYGRNFEMENSSIFDSDNNTYHTAASKNTRIKPPETTLLSILFACVGQDYQQSMTDNDTPASIGGCGGPGDVLRNTARSKRSEAFILPNDFDDDDSMFLDPKSR